VSDDAKGMLAARPSPRACAVDQPPALAQRRCGVGAPIDSVAHAAGLVGLPVGFLPVRLIAEYFPLPVKKPGCRSTLRRDKL
jgi:hypothetical protein